MLFHKKPAVFIREVKLRVSDLHESVIFYTEVLGLKIKMKSAESVSFTTNGQDILLTIVQPEEIRKKQEQTSGLYHFALLLPKRSDLAQVVRHFVNKAVRFSAGDHLVSEALYLNDPDGNGIEIYADRKSEEWEWEDGEVIMTTEPVNFEDLLKEPATSTWNGLPSETVMGHIHLQVSDLKKNEVFYVNGLGFEVVSRYGDNALFLSNAKYHHHIALNTWSGTQIRNAEKLETGIENYSIIFPTHKAREEKIASLTSMGESVIEEDGQYYIFDPSGIQVNLIVS